MHKKLLAKVLICMLLFSTLFTNSNFILNKNEEVAYASWGPVITDLSQAVIITYIEIPNNFNVPSGGTYVEITFDSSGKANLKVLASQGTQANNPVFFDYIKSLTRLNLGNTVVKFDSANQLSSIKSIRNGLSSGDSQGLGADWRNTVIFAGHKTGACSPQSVQSGSIYVTDRWDSDSPFELRVSSDNSIKFYDAEGNFTKNYVRGSSSNDVSQRVMNMGLFAWQDADNDGVWKLINGDGRYSISQDSIDTSARYPMNGGSHEAPLYPDGMIPPRLLVYSNLAANSLTPNDTFSVRDTNGIFIQVPIISTPCGDGVPSPQGVDGDNTDGRTVVVKCSDGSTATRLADGSYQCKSQDPSNNPGGGDGNTTINIGGGGGPLIEIPRFDYNHSLTNVNNISINQSTDPGANLGEIKDKSKEVTLKGTVTNIPNNGIVYLTAGGFQPNLLVQSKNDSGIIPSGTAESLTVSNFLRDRDDIQIYVNTIDLNKHPIDGKTITDFEPIYTNCTAPNNAVGGSNGIECTLVNQNTGVADLNNFKITKPGRYLLTVYLRDSKGQEYVYYKVVDARELGEFTGLPVQNRLTAMVENKSIKEKTTNKTHQFTDMKFTFSGSKEDSLAVPSTNNSLTNRIVLGSTEKGVRLLNNDLTIATMSGVNLNNSPITDVQEINGTEFVYVSSSSDGCFIINTKTGYVVKVTSLLSDNIQSIDLKGNLLYLSFDNAVGAYYIDSTNKAHLRDRITSDEIFGSNVKLGELNLIGSIITINTHHSSANKQMALISKF